MDEKCLLIDQVPELGLHIESYQFLFHLSIEIFMVLYKLVTEYLEFFQLLVGKFEINVCQRHAYFH